MKLLHFFLGGLLLCSTMACATTGQRAQKGAADSQPVVEQAKKPTNFYYDFDDVLVPKEMELNAKESVFYVFVCRDSV